jgi:hypothetical protein
MARVQDKHSAREALAACGHGAAWHEAPMKPSTTRQPSWRFSHVAGRRASGLTVDPDGWTRRILVLDFFQPRHFLITEPPASARRPVDGDG